MGKINYKDESQRLDNYIPGESSDFWKPVEGKHRVKALSELEDTEPYVEEGKDPRPQVKIRLLINGKEMTWTIGVGATRASTYGQLIKLAQERGDKLTGEEFTIVVVNDGNKNKYTIV